MKDKAYEAVGPNYRFFLTWRHAAFAGNLIVLWGTSRLLISAYKEGTPFIWLIPMLSSLVALCLWLADKRTRQIYRAIVKAGKDLEEDGKGPYTELNKILIPKHAPWFPKKGDDKCKVFSQSFALNCFFLGSSIALFFLSMYLLFCPLNRTPNTSKVQSPTQTLQVTSVPAPSAEPGPPEGVR